MFAALQFSKLYSELNRDNVAVFVAFFQDCYEYLSDVISGS
jgi:hypothetical protein